MKFSKTTISVLAFVWGGFVAIPAAQAQTTWYVDDANCPGPGSGSEADPFCKIQDGIDASASGDEVIVADGTYTGDGNRDLDFGGRDIHLRSESLDPELCIIDCQGSQANPHRGFYLHSGETTAAIVEGFKITGGYMTGPNEADNKGGAFYVEASAATLRHCVFTDNTVDTPGNLQGGGALGAVDAILDISDCAFSQNHAISPVDNAFGGALLAVSSTLTFTRCTMTNNTAGSFGAALILGVSTWIDCTVANNTATNIISFMGGLTLAAPGPHLLQGCEITGNQADQGGGGSAVNSTLEDCLIANNIANRNTGGFAGTVIRNSVIRDNHSDEGVGGAIFGIVENCVITGNTSRWTGGVVAGTVSGCLIMGNSSSGGDFVPFIAGGVHADRVIDSIVVGNTSTVVAGGIHVRSEVVNCLVIGNSAPRGAGILAFDQQQGDVRIVNCTVVGNTATVAGGGVASLGWSGGKPHTATVSNSIVWGNSAPVGAQLAALDFMDCCHGHPSELTVEYTDSQGGQGAVHVDPRSTLNWGLGNIDTDPLFVDADGPDDDPETWEDNDYRLQADSPCIDAGDNAAVPTGVTTDLDGNPRFVDDPLTPDCQQAPGQCGDCPVVNMGAYEFQEGVTDCCPADFDSDGTVGAADLAQLLGSWGPYEPCPPFDAADFNEDCGVNAADLAQLLGDWGMCK